MSGNSLRDNKGLLIRYLETIKGELQIDSQDFMPLTKLVNASDISTFLLEEIDSQSLFKIGNINLKQQLTIVNNRIKGLHYGLKTKSLNKKSIQPTLASTNVIINKIIDEVSIKEDRKLIASHINKIKNNEISGSENFDSMPEAMQELLRKMEYDRTNTIDKASSRDFLHVSGIMQRNQEEFVGMERAIKKAELDKNDDENFVLIKGPVLISANLNTQKLQNSGVQFDIVYFPGARGVPGMMKSEATTRMYILRDQILVVLLKEKKKKFQLKLNKKPFKKALKEDDDRYPRLNADLLEILHQKLNYPFVNIGSETGKFIVNRKFPNARFMWVMKRDQYQKIGSFTVNDRIGLPF